jgi:hypothetical protein
VYLLEALLKLYTLSPHAYFHSAWNSFDFFVVVTSLIDFFFEYVLNGLDSISVITDLIKILRLFRVTRVLKIVKKMEGLKKLIGTMIFSLPSLLNVSTLVFLTYYIFTILSCFLFENATFLQYHVYIRDGNLVNVYDF